MALAAAVALAAAGIWLRIATTIHDAQPVPVPRQPRVNALVWSHRVFVDAATFKRWLDAHHVSFAAWERQHPRGLAVFHRRPTPHR